MLSNANRGQNENSPAAKASTTDAQKTRAVSSPDSASQPIAEGAAALSNTTEPRRANAAKISVPKRNTDPVFPATAVPDPKPSPDATAGRVLLDPHTNPPSRATIVAEPKSVVDGIAGLVPLVYQPRTIVSNVVDGVHHERQSGSFCGLHALNSILYSLNQPILDAAQFERDNVDRQINAQRPIGNMPDDQRMRLHNAALAMYESPLRVAADGSLLIVPGSSAHQSMLMETMERLANERELETTKFSYGSNGRPGIDPTIAEQALIHARAIGVLLRSGAQREMQPGDILNGVHWLALVRPLGEEHSWAIVDSMDPSPPPRVQGNGLDAYRRMLADGHLPAGVVVFRK